MSAYPLCLYHYTNINSLAQILKNETLKLNSLSNVDDLEEAKSKDLQSIGQYVFVSCWSSDEKESIPNWHIYGDKMNGIRIKLPIYPFKTHHITKADVIKTLTPDIMNDWKIEGSGLLSFCRPEYVYNNNHYTFAGAPTESTVKIYNDLYRDILCQVNYTEDKSKIYPSIYRQEEDKETLSLQLVGIYKNGYWDFQSEFRYRIVIMPFSQDETYKYPLTFMNTAFQRIRQGVRLPITSLYLDLDSKYFNDMEITMGPLCNDGDYYVVEQLLISKGLNPLNIMKRSDLADKIRNA